MNIMIDKRSLHVWAKCGLVIFRKPEFVQSPSTDVKFQVCPMSMTYSGPRSAYKNTGSAWSQDCFTHVGFQDMVRFWARTVCPHDILSIGMVEDIILSAFFDAT